MVVNERRLLMQRQKANLEYAHEWLSRSRKDFNAFKKLAPFAKKTQRVTRCSDPALAVYLLQQSVEKATKAIAVASGRYQYAKLRRYSHNSLALFLDFYGNMLSLMLSDMGLEPMFKAFGLDAEEGLGKIKKLKKEAKKKGDKKKGEASYEEQFASMSSEAIDRLMTFLLTIRNTFLGAVKTIFGPHEKVQINREAINTVSNQAFLSSLLTEAQTKLNIPQLSQDQMDALSIFLNILAPGGIDSVNEDIGKTITIDRDTSQWLGQWAMIALLLLATITFPHEHTSRYPSPSKRTKRQLGCQNYDEHVGIVNRLGVISRVTELALDDIKPQLEAVATFSYIAALKSSKETLD